MITKYLALGNSKNITQEQLCTAISECGECGDGLLNTVEEAKKAASKLVEGVVFEVRLEFKEIK